MNRPLSAACLAVAAALGLALRAEIPAAAQSFGNERTFPQSPDVVERALAKIRPTAKGRLPTLEGFVGTTDQPLERYSSGYYECSIKLSQADSGGTRVRVTAKVTAWYADSNPARSGYRTIPSNGRLETDLLDRIAEVLEPKSTQGATTLPSGDSRSASPQPAPSVPSPERNSGLPAYLSPRGPGLAAPSAAQSGAGVADLSAAKPPAAQPAVPELDRARAEQHAAELRNLAQNLEEIRRNQSHPENLAAVRKSGTRVYAKPQTGAQVLFAAEAQDEFQILQVQPAWVQVQISGASRGWIHRDQLELPQGFADSSVETGNTHPMAGITFRVIRETVSKYSGSWQPLKGKPVKIFDVEPSAGLATSPEEKREFARSLLSAHTESAPGADALAGVVVVFDSSDGGQISATLADLKQFQEGRISEAEFWRRCSLDPLEAFENRSKP